MIRIVSGPNEPLKTSLADILDCLDSTKFALVWKITDFEGVKHSSQELFAGYESIIDFERDSRTEKLKLFDFEDLVRLSNQISQIHNATIAGCSKKSSELLIKIEAFDSWEWTIECENEYEILKRLKDKNHSDSVSIEVDPI